MGKMNSKKKIAIISVLAGAMIISSAATLGVSLSFYFAVKRIDQAVKTFGRVNPSIFLNYNVWDVNDVNEEYYMYAWNSSNADYSNRWIGKSTFLNGVQVSGSGSYKMYVFELDIHEYDRFIFVRMDADGDCPSWGAKWNQTDDITYNSSVNYYCIDNFDNDLGNHNSGYSTNHISLSGTNLVFG